MDPYKQDKIRATIFQNTAPKHQKYTKSRAKTKTHFQPIQKRSKREHDGELSNPGIIVNINMNILEREQKG